MDNKQYNLYYSMLDKLKQRDCYVKNAGDSIREFDLEYIASRLTAGECVFLSEYTMYKGSHGYMFKRLKKALDSIIYEEILCG